MMVSMMVMVFIKMVVMVLVMKMVMIMVIMVVMTIGMIVVIDMFRETDILISIMVDIMKTMVTVEIRLLTTFVL